MDELCRWFEDSIQLRFSPLDEACEDEFAMPVSGVPDMAHLGLEAGFLRLSRFQNPCTHSKCSRGDIQSIFGPIFDQIYKLADRQILGMETRHGAKLKVLHGRMTISDNRRCLL